MLMDCREIRDWPCQYAQIAVESGSFQRCLKSDMLEGRCNASDNLGFESKLPIRLVWPSSTQRRRQPPQSYLFKGGALRPELVLHIGSCERLLTTKAASEATRNERSTSRTLGGLSALYSSCRKPVDASEKVHLIAGRITALQDNAGKSRGFMSNPRDVCETHRMTSYRWTDCGVAP